MKLGYRRLKTKPEKIETTGKKFAGSWPKLLCDGIATVTVAVSELPGYLGR